MRLLFISLGRVEQGKHLCGDAIKFTSYSNEIFFSSSYFFLSHFQANPICYFGDCTQRQQQNIEWRLWRALKRRKEIMCREKERELENPKTYISLIKRVECLIIIEVRASRWVLRTEWISRLSSWLWKLDTTSSVYYYFLLLFLLISLLRNV